MVIKNDGKNGGIDELWVENEIGFGWIGLGWWRSRRCWGATISPVLGCDSSVLRCAIGALAGAWMCNQSSCCFSLSLFYFPGMEINCRQNTSVKYFIGFWGMIYSQRKSFSVWVNFPGQPKHAQWCKIFSGNFLLPKQMHPKFMFFLIKFWLKCKLHSSKNFQTQ